MKRQFNKILAAILTSAAAFSVFSTGASASSSTGDGQAAVTYEAAAVSVPAASVSEDSAPSADSSKVGVIPSKMYKYRITDAKDYVDAVRNTMGDSKSVSDAIKAVNNYVSSVDNTKSKYFPSVGYQIGGTCCAWANVYYQLTYQVNKKLDRAASSETNMQPVFVYNLARQIEGGIMPDTCMEIVAHAGCATFKMAPDKSDLNTWHPDYDTWLEANQYRISSYMYYEKVGGQDSRITSEKDPDLDAIKSTIRNGDLICFTSLVGFCYDYIGDASGVPKELVGRPILVQNNTSIGAHEMTIVGYNDNIWVDINKNGKVDEGEKGAFKVIDNYGPGTYGDGCEWFAYDSLNTQSAVKGVSYNERRVTSMYDLIKLNIAKDFKPSNIFLKYTVSTANRADNYIEVTAERKSDGVRFTSKTSPYCTINKPYTESALNGKTGSDDGTMIFDLDNIIPDLDSNNFHDYNWSVKFVDSGNDNNNFTVKEAVIYDANEGNIYALDTAIPFSVKSSSRDIKLKNYYHFAKLYTPSASKLTVGSKLTFTFKTANEALGSSPIKYTMTVSQDGKLVFKKVHKATTVYKDKKYSVIKGTWTPTKAGIYTVAITGTDASGARATRYTEIRVYNKMLAVRSITIDKGNYVSPYDKIKITPLVVGGKAPYTYSYYYIKGDKTYKIAEKIKSSSKTKQLGAGTGSYKLLVKVKDSNGKTAQATQSFTVSKTRVTRFIYNQDKIDKNQTLYIHCAVRNLAECVKDTTFEYTAEKNGQVETLQYKDPKWPNQVVWTPSQDGLYTIRVKVKYNGKLLAEKQDTYQVGISDSGDMDGMRKINVYVINHVTDKTNPSDYKLRYWGGKAGAVDAKCTATGSTKSKNVGFWPSAQSFKQFTAYIPLDATGFKFHIGDRWFPATGGDGSVSSHNTLYAFNYDYDRVLYAKE